MKGPFLVALLLIIVGNYCNAQDATWVWGKRLGSAGISPVSGSSETARDMKIDQFGNVYLCGSVNYSSSMLFDTSAVNAYGEEDCYLAKFSPSGELLWSMIAGTEGSGDQPSKLALDTVNNLVYFAGNFLSDFTKPFLIGNDTITSDSIDDFFLAQLDYQGNMNWVQTGMDQGSRIHALSTDSKGRLNAILTSDSGQLVSSLNLNSSGMYWCKIDQFGSVLSHKKISDRSDISISDMVTDVTGNSYAGGSFEDTAIISGQTFISEGSEDALLIKFDSTGTALWINKEGHPNGIAEISQLDIDSISNLYFIGTVFGNSFDWAGELLGKARPIQSVLGSYDSNGSLEWVTNTTGNNAQPGVDVTVGKKYVYFTGVCAQQLKLDGLTIFGLTVYDPYLARYKMNGEIVSLDQIRGMSRENAGCIASNDKDSVYMAGTFQLDIQHQNINLQSLGLDGDVFLAKCGLKAAIDTINDTTGIEQLWPRYQSMKIYPNPSNGVFSFTINENISSGSLEIMSTSGQLVYQNTITENNQQKITVNLPNGLYHVLFNTASAVFTGKIQLTN